MWYYILPSVAESGHVDRVSKAEGGADADAGLRRRQDALGAADSEVESAVTQLCGVAAVAEDETLGGQRTELDSAQRRKGPSAAGVGGVVGDLRTVKRDRLVRTTTWSGRY